MNTRHKLSFWVLKFLILTLQFTVLLMQVHSSLTPTIAPIEQCACQSSDRQTL